MHTHMHPCAHVLPARMHMYARASAYVDRRSRACSLHVRICACAHTFAAVSSITRGYEPVSVR